MALILFLSIRDGYESLREATFFQLKVLERNTFSVKMVCKRLRVGPRGVASPYIKPCRAHSPGFKEDITSVSLWIWVLTGL